jgi:hypothetical protein
MKYLCLIYDAEARYATMSEAQTNAMMQEYFAFSGEAGASGNLLGGEELAPSTTATTVRVRGGKVATTDGPFAETKEQLGGYFVVEARDLNEAIALAARIPGAKTGCVEVRPIVDHSGSA